MATSERAICEIYCPEPEVVSTDQSWAYDEERFVTYKERFVTYNIKYKGKVKFSHRINWKRFNLMAHGEDGAKLIVARIEEFFSVDYPPSGYAEIEIRRKPNQTSYVLFAAIRNDDQLVIYPMGLPQTQDDGEETESVSMQFSANKYLPAFEQMVDDMWIKTGILLSDSEEEEEEEEEDE